MLTFPQIDPVAVAIGPLKIRWYALTYIVGFAAAWWLGTRRAKDRVVTALRAAGPLRSWIERYVG